MPAAQEGLLPLRGRGPRGSALPGEAGLNGGLDAAPARGWGAAATPSTARHLACMLLLFRAWACAWPGGSSQLPWGFLIL